MKENLKLGAILLAITLTAGVLLGVTNELTKEQILINSKINKEDLALVMPKANSIKEVDIEHDQNILEIYEAVNGDEIYGYIIKVVVKGFHGPIKYIIGISDDTISGIKVLLHSETPGLGAKIEEENFRSQYTGKSTGKELEAVKKAPVADNEIQGISGATISSKATTTAVNTAIKFYKEKIKGEKVVSIPRKEYKLNLDDERLMTMILGTEMVTEKIEETTEDIIKVYIANESNNVIGHIIMAKAEGFNGDIVMLVGIDKRGIVSGFEILEEEETEGLGALIVEENYKSQFVGKNVGKEFMIVQGKANAENEIEAISGATISSKASVKAINSAMEYYLNNIKE